MASWTVHKYVTESGRCPFDKWTSSKAVTTKDKAALDAKVDTIEQIQSTVLPPETLKRYKKTGLYELKVRGDKKQLRPLAAVQDGQIIILLCGAIEKGGKIPDGDIEQAENLADALRKRRGTLKDYYED